MNPFWVLTSLEEDVGTRLNVSIPTPPHSLPGGEAAARGCHHTEASGGEHAAPGQGHLLRNGTMPVRTT